MVNRFQNQLAYSTPITSSCLETLQERGLSKQLLTTWSTWTPASIIGTTAGIICHMKPKSKFLVTPSACLLQNWAVNMEKQKMSTVIHGSGSLMLWGWFVGFPGVLGIFQPKTWLALTGGSNFVIDRAFNKIISQIYLQTTTDKLTET